MPEFHQTAEYARASLRPQYRKWTLRLFVIRQRRAETRLRRLSWLCILHRRTQTHPIKTPSAATSKNEGASKRRSPTGIPSTPSHREATTAGGARLSLVLVGSPLDRVSELLGGFGQACRLRSPFAVFACNPYGWHMPMARTSGLRKPCRYLGEPYLGQCCLSS
jgi:hypothetical protein